MSDNVGRVRLRCLKCQGNLLLRKTAKWQNGNRGRPFSKCSNCRDFNWRDGEGLWSTNPHCRKCKIPLRLQRWKGGFQLCCDYRKHKHFEEIDGEQAHELIDAFLRHVRTSLDLLALEERSLREIGVPRSALGWLLRQRSYLKEQKEQALEWKRFLERRF